MSSDTSPPPGPADPSGRQGRRPAAGLRLLAAAVLLLAPAIVLAVLLVRGLGPAGDGASGTTAPPATTSPATAATPGPGTSLPAVPEDAISALNVGVRHLEQFQYEQAAARFEEALRSAPGWLPAAVDLAVARLNMLEPEQAQAAEEAARRAHALAPDDARARYVLAYALAERRRSFAEALPLLREVVRQAPADGMAWYQLGRAAEELAADAGPDAAALAAEARRAYERALEAEPGMPEANYRLGRMLLDAADAADQERGRALLEGHAALLEGRPPVQQNYLTRGELARAYPFRPARPAPAPSPIELRRSPPLALLPPLQALDLAGQSPNRFRGGIALADLDADGRVEIVAPMRERSQPMATIWSRTADGAWSEPSPLGEGGASCSTASPSDLDGDGDVDMVFTCNVGQVVYLAREGRLEPAPPSDMRHAAVAGATATPVDLDHDGDLDLHVISPLAQVEGRLQGDQWAWLNDGSGSFRQSALTLGLHVPATSTAALWSDLDGDNAVDLVVSVAAGLTVFHNSREGTFTPVPLPPLPGAAAAPETFVLDALDADGDADLDLVVIARGRLVVLANDSSPGRLAFRALEAGALDPVPGAVVVADMDLDGVREVVLFGGSAGADPGRAAVREIADGARPPHRLVLRSVDAEGLDPFVVAAGDVDSDGDVDLVARQRTGEPVVLENLVAAGGAAPSLRLDLIGRAGRSNPHGLGAKLTVDAGSSSAYLERRACQGPLAHVVLPEIVGLGGRASADGASVLWPSGIRQGETGLAAGATRRIEELDRQPSSCPMLYAWDGSRWAFQTDCFDTAPAGLWVAPGTFVQGDPEEAYRLRPGALADDGSGLAWLSVAEFLNETLLADAVALAAIDEPGSRTVVVDEGVRLAAPPPPAQAWSLGPSAGVRARLDGRDVTRDLAAEDRRMAGWSRALRWTGLAQPHALELDVPHGDGVLVLTGSLNFPNSSSLYGAHQAGVSVQPARLEVRDGARWRELAADCGAPAGFFKDVVIDLRPHALGRTPATLRVTTNLQASWDRAAFHEDVRTVELASLPRAPMVAAAKAWLGIPREVQGEGNRWREFPREPLDGRSDWQPQDGPVTPDGDVRAHLAAADGDVAFVRPGEEVRLGFDVGSLGAPAPDARRTLVLLTHGWVKDADPRTHSSWTVLPVPRAGDPSYP